MSSNSQLTNKDIYLLESELTAVATNSHRENHSWFYNIIPIMNTLLAVSAIGAVTQMFLIYIL